MIWQVVVWLGVVGGGSVLGIVLGWRWEWGVRWEYGGLWCDARQLQNHFGPRPPLSPSGMSPCPRRGFCPSCSHKFRKVLLTAQCIQSNENNIRILYFDICIYFPDLSVIGGCLCYVAVDINVVADSRGFRYMLQQATRPETVGHAFADSPAGEWCPHKLSISPLIPPSLIPSPRKPHDQCDTPSATTLTP